jgi:hypothetical protein
MTDCDAMQVIGEIQAICNIGPHDVVDEEIGGD